MNFISKTIFAAMAAATCLCGAAQETDNQNMYLIKGDRVVGRYDVDAVDYVTFKKPEGIQESNLWLSVDNVTKNTVTYTVNTIAPTITYAHGFVSYYDVNYLAMDEFGDFFENLEEADQVSLLQTILPYCAYLGVGTETVTRTDFEPDGFSRIVLTPGTPFFLCAWEVDPATQKPYETFVYQEFSTEAPGEFAGNFDVTFKRQNSEGLAFDISGSSDILYITTAFGEKNMMDLYVEYYGEDFLFGTFGQTFTLDVLQGENEIGDGIEAATWPAYETGDYVLMVRAYDANGDMKAVNCEAHYEGETAAGPEITIFSKSKGDGKVSVNFEVSPNKVSEAYVRMLLENTVEDRLNSGWELWEIASGGDAIDIYDDIRNYGEYTFKADGIDDQWHTLLIYARDMDGNRTTLRINFNMLEDSNWSIYEPVYNAPARRAIARIASKSRKPTLDKVK